MYKRQVDDRPLSARIDGCRAYILRAEKRAAAAEAVVKEALQRKEMTDADLAGAELYSLENELSLEELLTARNRAEELMHDDEDDGEFHDAEESELERRKANFINNCFRDGR